MKHGERLKLRLVEVFGEFESIGRSQRSFANLEYCFLNFDTFCTTLHHNESHDHATILS
jgi:hypothetical protein